MEFYEVIEKRRTIRDFELEDILKEVIERVISAATNEGYGCNLRIPLGNESEHAREILGYPEEYYMPCFIGIGRPKANVSIPKQKDIDIKDKIHWDIF